MDFVAMAAPPKLASEKIFENLDLYDTSLSVTIVERRDQTTRSLSFKNKPELFEKIKKALSVDKSLAVSKSLVSNNGEISESIVIINDDEEIKIGLTCSKSKEVYFFIRSEYKNNHNTIQTNGKKSTRSKKSSRSQRSTVFEVLKIPEQSAKFPGGN